MQRFTFQPTALPGVVEIAGTIRHDNRGSAHQAFSADEFAGAGIGIDWPVEMEFRCPKAHTLRGLHFPFLPLVQDRLIRVARGGIREVIADIDPASPTYLKSVSIALSAAAANQLAVPSRYAHGFVTLEADTIISIRFSSAHVPGCEGAIRHDDPQIAADWGLAGNAPILSERDATAPSLEDWTQF